MKSTIGRPRSLTDEEVSQILAWHDAFRALSVQRKALITLRQLAADLDVPRSTLYDVIRRRGEFKLPSPDRKPGRLHGRRRKSKKATRTKVEAESRKA